MHQLLDHDGTYSDTASEILWVSRQLFAAARQELGHLSERQDRLISNNHWHHDSRLTTLWCRSNSVPSRVSQAAHWIKNDCPRQQHNTCVIQSVAVMILSTATWAIMQHPAPIRSCSLANAVKWNLDAVRHSIPIASLEI